MGKEKVKKEKKEKKSRRERPGKNTNLKEMFESGKIDNYDSDDERSKRKEQIKIERAQQARSIKDRFEKGEAFGDKDSDDDRNYTDERRECEEIFREAETARAARKRFNQIDSKVKRDGGDIMRTQSFANAPISNRRLSQDGLEATDAPDFGIVVDPNYVRSSDKQYDENIDCARTKKLLDMFKKMEMQNSDEDERGPPPPRRFTPPPEGEEYDSEEYSDEEYTDDDDEEEKEDEDEDEVKQNGFDEEEPKPKKKVTKIIKVKKEKVKKERKEKKSRRERPMSIAGAQAGELKQQWESKNRRDKMRETRSKELSKFRAMLCAGKNTNLKEMFE